MGKSEEDAAKAREDVELARKAVLGAKMESTGDAESDDARIKKAEVALGAIEDDEKAARKAALKARQRALASAKLVADTEKKIASAATGAAGESKAKAEELEKADADAKKRVEEVAEEKMMAVRDEEKARR